ncbi:MAG: L,D-transpeptidase family protein [Flavobacteriales bacterium]|nr:L,D-transpeptidase family protein [Flavobacteriales bacterium]
MRLTFLSAILTLFCYFSCSTPEPIEEFVEEILVDSTAIYERMQREQDSTLTAFFLEQYIDMMGLIDGGILRGRTITSPSIIPDLYQRHSQQLFWKDSLDRERAIEVLEKAYEDGLEPDEYHLEAIRDLDSQASDDFDILTSLDILITDGLIHYFNHLLSGRLDPKTHVPNLIHDRRSFMGSDLPRMFDSFASGRPDSLIGIFRPPSQYYHYMMKGLEHYTQLNDSGAWKVTSITERKLEPGGTYSDIPSIRERLRVEGDFMDLKSNLDDSLSDEKYYDPILQRAVERFQIRHGLNPDGVIGRGTVEAMNISAQEKVDLLKINLERARWIHHDLDSNYVLVNIAGFDLRLVKGDTLCWTTKVMVGKKSTSTPVFRDMIEYIEVNPDWTVPFSISNYEILPKLKVDESYLRRNNMELLTMSGTPVDESAIDFNDFEEKMPYIVRQGPGDNNSLGRVKFLFPNQFRVYLHDTPSKNLFVKEQRAFSHGCIRVQNPFRLAEYLLSDQGVTPAYIDSIRQTEERFRFDLETPIPVLITYSTASADADLVYFYEDVYGRDEEIRLALRPTF